MITNTITITLYIFDDYDYDYDLYFYYYDYDYDLYFLIMITIVQHKDSVILREFNNRICLLLLLINISFSNKLSLNRLLPKCNDRNKKPKRPFHSENWPIIPEN